MLSAEDETAGLDLARISNDVATTGDSPDGLSTDGTADLNELDAEMEGLEIFEATMNCDLEHWNMNKDLVSLHGPNVFGDIFNYK